MGNMISNVGKMLLDVSHGPYDLTHKGKCSGCGACCTNILPLSNNEIRSIKYYIKKNNIKEQIHILNVMAEKPVLDMTCPFLNNQDNNRCTIYEVRPEICREFKCDEALFDNDGAKLINFMNNKKNYNVRETFFPK